MLGFVVADQTLVFEVCHAIRSDFHHLLCGLECCENRASLAKVQPLLAL